MPTLIQVTATNGNDQQAKKTAEHVGKLTTKERDKCIASLNNQLKAEGYTLFSYVSVTHSYFIR